MRKTKIVCTLGPATNNEDMISGLMKEGMNVARFNFSHGTHEGHKKVLEMVCKIRNELNLPVATMLDTKGPEIRIGEIEGNVVELESGQLFTLTTKELIGNEEIVSITYKNLIHDVKPGTKILIDDGLILMNVLEVKDENILCVVENGGKISSNKGVNVPGVQLNIPFISTKDYDDIIFGIEQGFDFIALSFTRSAEDVLSVRKIINEKGKCNVNLIAKIENQQGVDNIDDIIKVSDGIMIARGDMGVEIPLEDVPIIQKILIEKAYNAGRQVITATQMLESMIKNPRPTRAETSDVANAIFQGTSAIMLSGETAAGLYPIEALKTMVKIAKRAEDDVNYEMDFRRKSRLGKPNITNAISHATCTTASDLNASAIITITKSGKTAKMISKYRPNCKIICCTPDKSVQRQLNLSWGVSPLLIREEDSIEGLFEESIKVAKENGLIHCCDVIVLTAGAPLGVAGNTNLIKACVVGE